MAKYDFSRSKVLIAEQSMMIKQGLRNPLRSMGFRELVDASTVVATLDYLHKESFDFICISAELDNTDSTHLVREIRRGKMHRDPFTVILLVISKTEDVHVKAAINSGADDILVVPFSSEQIFTRMLKILEQRKPFVVTHDYIGPERRGSSRAGASTARQIAVPNPLLARSNNMPDEKYEQAVATASATIDAERIRSLAKATLFEVESICAASMAGTMAAGEMVPNFFKLEEISQEMIERLKGKSKTDFLEAFNFQCKKLKNNPGTATAATMAEFHENARIVAKSYS